MNIHLNYAEFTKKNPSEIYSCTDGGLNMQMFVKKSARLELDVI